MTADEVLSPAVTAVAAHHDSDAGRARTSCEDNDDPSHFENLEKKGLISRWLPGGR
jgi:hypothetical protein